MKNIARFIAAAAIAVVAQTASAQNVFVGEAPTNIRFEQYTGPSGNIVFWRMPSPGASEFPSSSCKNLIIPGDKPEHASRFMALYLFAKSNSKQIFYVFSPTTCVISSFGIDG